MVIEFVIRIKKKQSYYFNPIHTVASFATLMRLSGTIVLLFSLSSSFFLSVNQESLLQVSALVKPLRILAS